MPLDRAAAEAAERCFYCPKMCRFSCPVGHESAQESLTPWGKMTLLSSSVPREDSLSLPSPLASLARTARRLLDGGPQATLDADTAEAFYACTGCLRCRTWCNHENDVPAALLQGRAEAASRGLAPAAARAVVDRFLRRGHDQNEDPRPILARIAAEHASPSGATSVLFGGCETAVNRPEVLSAALSSARALGVPLPLATDPACCGRPLLEAGYLDEFRAHVAAAWERLGDREVVVTSAACARALVEGARAVGVEPRGPVVHATTYLARRLGPEIEARPLPGEVTYHDPCHLGRGLGEYEAPRRLLAAALQGGVREAAENREASDCCGASGLLPRTYPEVAKSMAMSRADALRESAPPDRPLRVATACPSCSAVLRGAGLDVVDVVEIVGEWLAQAPTARDEAGAPGKP